MQRAVFALFIGIASISYVQAESAIRVNQLGYLPVSTKVAVLMTDASAGQPAHWDLRDALTGEVVWESVKTSPEERYGSFYLWALDFSSFRGPGAFTISVGNIHSPIFRIDNDVYDRSADFLLNYIREQQCGYNPLLGDSCHTHDGYIIYNPAMDSSFIDVVGGWHDASDYLRYVTTSATTVFQLLFAYEQSPGSFGDAFGGDGRPGPNGIPDILDAAKWGIDWLLKMNPGNGVMFNQVADDRDHAGFKLPTLDTISYGKGKERPVYYCTGEPQGLMSFSNRSTGIASTAGKFSSAFAIASRLLQPYYSELCPTLRSKAVEAYAFGRKHPGVCQTAPCRAPYFYEEDNWVDDMELAATQLHLITGDPNYLEEAFAYAEHEPVVPWMGADGARHYQWYPFVNLGHYYLATALPDSRSERVIQWIGDGIERISRRGATKPFTIGVPFIWCSNNLVSAALAQERIHSTLTQDTTETRTEAAMRDWLFGCNPWGTSMIIGLPDDGISPRDPHSAFSHVYDLPINGGLVDGPVRATIFSSLKGVQLSKDDRFKAFQSDSVVYHDDWADYSTNEPTLDGTASLAYYLSALQSRGGSNRCTMDQGGIIRMDSTAKIIYLVFSGDEFADGGTTIRATLRRQGVKASFFLTGDFYRGKNNRQLIQQLLKDGHYLGPHSDKHLLYAPWEDRDSLLVHREEFLGDLKGNYEAMAAYGIHKRDAAAFLPPFEWYNRQISDWSRAVGIRLVNFTPGTRANADYTVPGDANYKSSAEIERSILEAESGSVHGLNGFILLSHIGTDPRRVDKFYNRLDRIIRELRDRGYAFARF